MWGAGVLATGVGAAVLGIGALVVPDAARAMVHQRDEPAFLGYARTYVGLSTAGDRPIDGDRDRAWVGGRDEQVLVEGDAVCAWLDRQPPAPEVDPTRHFTVDVVARRYLAEAAATRPAELSGMGRFDLVAGAWEYLCWSSREDRTAPLRLRED